MDGGEPLGLPEKNDNAESCEETEAFQQGGAPWMRAAFPRDDGQRADQDQGDNADPKGEGSGA